jgi:hypothetical protein
MTGNNVWSGQVHSELSWFTSLTHLVQQTVQSLNTNAITWALAKELYGPGGAYFIIPMSLFIGAAATVVQWAIFKVLAF